MAIFGNIGEFLEFINISSQNQFLFEWKPPKSFRRYDLDLNIVKENNVSDIFFHIDKGNMKIVHIRKNDLIYTVGASIKVQFQLLEALLEHVSFKFRDTYDIDVILSYSNFNPNIFNSFK